MTAKEMSDDNFIKFQDDFYNLLEKYGVSSIDCEHKEFAEILNLRDRIAEFIEQELYKQEVSDEI
jgi:purine-nucleoside phosphorylase